MPKTTIDPTQSLLEWMYENDFMPAEVDDRFELHHRDGRILQVSMEDDEISVHVFTANHRMIWHADFNPGAPVAAIIATIKAAW